MVSQKALTVSQYKKEYLPALKKEKEYLKDTDKFVYENACRNVDDAYNRFFKGLSGFPKYASRTKPNGNSFTTNFTNNNIELKMIGGTPYVKLPKIGNVRFILPKGKKLNDIQPHGVSIKAATVNKEPDGLYRIALRMESVIDIDEIDSMGGRRHSKQNNYDRQTLNTLLSEMDGFDGSNGVVVIAATNRLEDLDPALTRPGRFDNHFAVSLPESAKERRVIIDLYTNNKKFAEDVDFDAFAKETMGSSPATIKTVLNEAAIIAARDNNGIIDRKILDEAWMKQLMEGHLRRNGERNNIEVVAWHEAGHALAGLLLGQDLTKASIIPSTSGAGGATFITPKKLGLFTVKELKEQVIMLYAGRNAEALLTESNGEEEGVTTGASNDIEKATDIIKKMIVEYGMNDEFGLLNLDNLDVKPEVITKEAVKLAKALQEQSLILMKENIDRLRDIAEELMKKETLTGEEIRKIAER